MLTGSCLCGAVAYEADAPLERIVHCHCQTCRKTHGSAFSSVTAVPREKFRWTRGQDRLGAIESSPGKFRRFCTTCGSHVMAERVAQPVVLRRQLTAIVADGAKDANACFNDKGEKDNAACERLQRCAEAEKHLGL